MFPAAGTCSPPLSFSPLSAAWLQLLWKGPRGPWVNPGPLPSPDSQEWGSPSPPSQRCPRVLSPSWQPAAVTREAGGGKPGTWCIQVNSGPRAVRPSEGGSGSPENSVGMGARPTIMTPSSRPRVSCTHRVRQRRSRTLSVIFNPCTQVGVAICSESQQERTCQFKHPAGGRFQISDMLLGGTASLCQGSLGPHPTPDCTLLGHQWVERVPKEAGSGGDAGLFSGVLSSFSALPHTRQLLHTLLLVSSLTRHQQVPERPCPQSPMVTVATRGDPTTPAPSISIAGALMASSTPQPTGGCPGTALAAPPSPTSCQVPVMCDDVG